MGRQLNHLQRRAFLYGMAGTGIGIALGIRPRVGAIAQGGVAPVPISGGSPAIAELGGQLFHVYGPGAEGFDPPDSEPITITDFDGTIGLAYIDGMATRTNMVTGESRQVPFVGNDMRFMKGAYRGTDGQIYQGTFAFI
jgi:hypothetical protein